MVWLWFIGSFPLQGDKNIFPRMRILEAVFMIWQSYGFALLVYMAFSPASCSTSVTLSSEHAAIPLLSIFLF